MPGATAAAVDLNARAPREAPPALDELRIELIYPRAAERLFRNATAEPTTVATGA